MNRQHLVGGAAAAVSIDAVAYAIRVRRPTFAAHACCDATWRNRLHW